MKATETKVNTFLASPDTCFAIPVYQRNYDWTIAQCRQLLDDIIQVGSQDNNESHFIGSIVYVCDDIYTIGSMNEFTIIDGQQRLTTLTIIYIALYNFAKKHNDESNEKRIHKSYLINEFDSNKEKLKLKTTENNKDALRFILEQNTSDNYMHQSRIIDNYNYIVSYISNDRFNLILNGLSRLIFVGIALDRNNDNPQRIFESLNSTGLELSQADLIRNYILMGLNRKDQERVFTLYWEPIEKNTIDESLSKTKISDFIRDFLTLKNREIPRKGAVYSAFKKKYPTSAFSDLTIILDELKTLSYYYNKIVNPKNESDKEIRIQLEYLGRLEVNVAHPFLMKVYDDFDKNRLSKIDFISILNLIQSFVFRRFILGLPTNALNKIFMNLYDKIDLDNYVKSLESSLLQKTGIQRFPRDLETYNAFILKDVYNIQAKNRNYLFDRLENFNNKEQVLIDGNPEITVEHIFPQKPDEIWKQDLGIEEFNSIKETYINTIGNLTLCGSNSVLSNRSFLEKRDLISGENEAGYSFSRLWLNRDLKSKSKWGISEIKERASNIGERFLQIWIMPKNNIDIQNTIGEVNIFDAESPKSKKLTYVVFLGQRIEVKEVAKLYAHVFKELYELEPERFYSAEVITRLGISRDPLAGMRQAIQVGDSFYIEGNIDNVGKFDRIKFALRLFEFEDELYICYAD